MNKEFKTRLAERDLETIPAKVARILKEAIIKGELKPGERLVQDELAKLIGVSRMPIREAIKQLETEGFITIESHKGAVVKAFTTKEIEEIYFLRAKFEPVAVMESLKYMTEEDIEELEKLVEQMNASIEIEDFISLNIQFHHLLIKHCPWEKLNNFVQQLWSGFPQLTPHLLTDGINESKSDHVKIVEAIKNYNHNLVHALIETHITRARENVLKNLSLTE